jgi:squalene-hopene/tetraprenyl-beta-curcumene cyclase
MLVHTGHLTSSNAENPWLSLALSSLNYLVDQSKSGFHEAIHTMSFPSEQGFSAPFSEHNGDIFQRAVIADCLLDIDEILHGQLATIINDEISYLLRSQQRSNVGGWKYFPTLPELPPDADDLAQIISILMRCRRVVDVDTYCQTPLSVLLTDNSRDDGSLETWIIPKGNRTNEEKMQVLWTKQAWGRLVDTEVVANILHSLVLYDYIRFQAVIESGVKYVFSQQNVDGSWNSSWYSGPFYGTFVCLRLLRRGGQFPLAITQARTFLIQSRNNDGGWGSSEHSDPLSTAFALLGLAICVSTGELDLSWLTPTLTYLQETQQSNQSWIKCPFIRMEIGRAQGQVFRVLHYGSRTITTAFVMKAAIAVFKMSAK